MFNWHLFLSHIYKKFQLLSKRGTERGKEEGESKRERERERERESCTCNSKEEPHPMILWTTPIIAVALYRSDSDSEGHLLTISISHYPLLSVFVFGFSIILHGFEFVTNNNNKKKKKLILGKLKKWVLFVVEKEELGLSFFSSVWVRWVRQKVKKKWRGGYISYAPIGLDYSTLANATSFSKIIISKASNLFPFPIIRSIHALNFFSLKISFTFFFAAGWVECFSVLCALFSGF